METGALFFWGSLKAIIAGISLVIVLVLLWLGWTLYRPDHFFNPINRFAQLEMMKCRAQPQGCLAIGSWSASMIPTVFRLGEPRDELLSRLDDAAGTTDLKNLCASAFFVDMSFDARGGLVAARSTASGYCL